MLHAKDEAPVKYERVCQRDGKPVAWEDLVKDLLRVINAKVKGRKPKLIDEDTSPKQAEVVDLMARLRASLEGKKSGSPRKAAASKGKKPARTRRRVA